MQVYIGCKTSSKQPSTKKHGEIAGEERMKEHRRFYDPTKMTKLKFGSGSIPGIRGSFPRAGLTARFLEAFDWKSLDAAKMGYH